jgi:hypothetical protein
MTTDTTPKAKASKRLSEEALLAKHPHIVKGSLRFDLDGTHANKQTVEINTRGLDGQPDGNTRRIATSDLHQVFWTPEVAKEIRKEKMRMKRKADRALLAQIKASAPVSSVEPAPEQTEAEVDAALAAAIEA